MLHFDPVPNSLPLRWNILLGAPGPQKGDSVGFCRLQNGGYWFESLDGRIHGPHGSKDEIAKFIRNTGMIG